MSTDSRETRRREAPIGAKSYKINGVQRVSPAWRKRSKSTSHDNTLYRMGARKNAQGEWTEVVNRVPPAMINAMKKLRLNSIKRETPADVYDSLGLADGTAERIDMTGDVEVMEDVGGKHLDMADPTDMAETGDAGGNDLDMADFEDAHDEEDDDGGDEGLIDMTDSTAVYGRIRIYLDVDKEVAGGHVYVNENGTKAEIVMTSVEANVMDMVEEKKVSKSGEVERANAPRESMTSIAEEVEESLDVDPTNGLEPQQSSTDSLGEESSQPTKKGKGRWTDDEIRYVGALKDGGFKEAEILQSFRTRFPGRTAITMSTICAIRKKCFSDLLHLQQSRLLGQELGLVTGKWSRMTLALVQHTQTIDQQSLMAEHRLELDQGNEVLLASSNEQARLEAHSAMRHILVAQRTQARDLRRQQYIRLNNFYDRDQGYKHYLAQLTILIHRSQTVAVAYQAVTKAYALPIEFEDRLNKKIVATTGGLDVHAHEYDVAMSLLEEKHGMTAELDYHHEAMELLDFDKFVSDGRRFKVDLELPGKNHQRRRMLHIQQDERRRLFEERQKEGLLGENNAKPLEAPKILVLLREETFYGGALFDALLSSDEGEKERIEASLRAMRPGLGFWKLSNALISVWSRHCARKEEAEVVTNLLQGVRDTLLKQLYEQLHQQQTSRKFLFEQQKEEDAKSNVVPMQTSYYPGPLETSKIVDLISETLAEWRWLSALLEEDEMDKQRLESSLRKVIELPLGERPTLWTRRSDCAPNEKHLYSVGDVVDVGR